MPVPRNPGLGTVAHEAAICMMQVVSEQGKSIVFKGSGVLHVVHEPSVLEYFTNPAFCTSRHDFRDTVGYQDWELIWQPMFPYGGWGHGFRIPLPLALNKSLEEQSDAYKTHMVSTVVSLVDSV